MQTLKVTVTLEIRADIDDDEGVKEAIKDALLESIEDDTLDYEAVEEDDLD